MDSCKVANDNAGDSNNNNKSYVVSVTDPKRLIPELCNHFYHLGWASGTGGGLSIRMNGLIYCAPSGVQKERLLPEDMFVIDENTGTVIESPVDPNYKCSECLPLFKVAFNLRQAGCCIHSHSVNANLITAAYTKRNMDNQQSEPNHYPKPVLTCGEFRISNQEMIKGIKKGSSDQNLQYNDMLVVPIIDNVLHERDLSESLQKAIIMYPETNAVLVRNHGIYVWGKTWQQAKSHAECYDYLFKLKLEALKCGLNWMLEE